MTAWRHDLLNISLSKFPVTGEIGIKGAEVSGLHKDPAGRLFNATALHHSVTLVNSAKLILS